MPSEDQAKASEPAIRIRAYGPADLDDVIRIFLSAIRQTAAKDYTPVQINAWAPADRERWARVRGERPTWVALVGSAIAGFTDLEPSGHLDMMYVDPTQQRRGVASLLLDRVETAARAQGLSRIFTEASITAQPFFLKRGFSLIAPQVVFIRGEYLTNFKLEKCILADATRSES